MSESFIKKLISVGFTPMQALVLNGGLDGSDNVPFLNAEGTFTEAMTFADITVDSINSIETSNIPLLDAANIFTGDNKFSGLFVPTDVVQSTTTETFNAAETAWKEKSVKLTVAKAATENVFILANVSSSQSAAGLAGGMLFKGGSALDTRYALGSTITTATTGRVDNFTIMHIDTSTDSGNITYGVGAYKNANGTTLYIRDILILGFKFRKE